MMALHGSSVPLDHGGFVVTVVCPNSYSYQRLMQALQNIVPDAGEPVVAFAAPDPARPLHVFRDPECDDDEGERDFTQCRVEGGCE